MKGYRGFSQGATLEFAPLSLVYGENSAGKSSLLRLVVSIAQAISGRSNEPLVPISTSMSPTSIRQLFGSNTSIELELEFLSPSNIASQLVYKIAYFPELNSTKIVELDVITPDQEGIKVALSAANHQASSYSIACGDREKLSIPALRFHGLIPQFLEFGSYSNVIGRTSPFWDALNRLAESLVWFGPLRHTPDRAITLTPYPSKFKQDGSDIVQALYPANNGGIAIAEWVSNWYRKTTNHILTIIPSTSNGQEVFSINLAHEEASHLGAAISDHGAGMSQVLPIVISCAIAQIKRAPMWLVLENPELHLHDKAHENLANLLMDTVAVNPNITVIAETHSENVLLALQLRTILNKAVPVAVVNWVQKEEEGHSVCKSFSFDDSGSLGGLWSKSIFGYTSDLARRIIQARREKEQN